MPILTFCLPCISVYLSQYLANLMHKICFTLSFILLPLHVSSTCAHHQEVKIALNSLWYNHTYRCSKHVEERNKLIAKKILCIKLVNTEINLCLCLPSGLASFYVFLLAVQVKQYACSKLCRDFYRVFSKVYNDLAFYIYKLDA